MDNKQVYSKTIGFSVRRILWDLLSVLIWTALSLAGFFAAEKLWNQAGEDTLRGVFLSRLRGLYDKAKTDEDRLRLEQAARWGLAALEHGGEVAVHENP